MSAGISRVSPVAGATGTVATISWSSTVSADGMQIGYASLGSGPGIVIEHGSMQSSLSHLDLARLLAAKHTVHLVDRRGRGRSSDGASGTNLEVGDLRAVLGATGARDVFAVSSGALIALRAALHPGTLGRLAVFEPALMLDGAFAPDELARFRREYARGDMAAYLVTAMLAAEMGPPIFARMPRPLLRLLTAAMLRSTDARDPNGAPTMRDLAPALRHDFGVVEEQAGRLSEFAAIDAPVLVMAGTRTRPYLRAAAEALSATIGGARLVDLPGLDHGATANVGERGTPSAVAPALHEFFAA
jgi:pimeloyl-ACP methyl ester carboxylesterase